MHRDWQYYYIVLKEISALSRAEFFMVLDRKYRNHIDEKQKNVDLGSRYR